MRLDFGLNAHDLSGAALRTGEKRQDAMPMLRLRMAQPLGAGWRLRVDYRQAAGFGPARAGRYSAARQAGIGLHRQDRKDWFALSAGVLETRQNAGRWALSRRSFLALDRSTALADNRTRIGARLLYLRLKGGNQGRGYASISEAPILHLWARSSVSDRAQVTLSLAQAQGKMSFGGAAPAPIQISMAEIAYERQISNTNAALVLALQRSLYQPQGQAFMAANSLYLGLRLDFGATGGFAPDTPLLSWVGHSGGPLH